MKLNALAGLKSAALALTILSLLSCDKLIEKATDTDPLEVHLTVDLNGKKTEMTSMGFTYFDESNGKREMQVPFANSASLLTVNAIIVTFPDFKEGKSSYSVQKGEVEVTYQEDVEVYDDQSVAWVSKTGTVEITSFNGKVLEGKISASLQKPSGSKTVELKNGSFKVEKLL